MNESFKKDLLDVFKKHQLALVPTYESEVSFHDTMTVVKLDTMTLHYVEDSDWAGRKAIPLDERPVDGDM